MPRPTGYLRLWNTSDDPWSTTTSSSTLLNELSSYWNTNMRAQKRTVVYMARWAALSVADSMATPAVQLVPAVEAGPLASTADSGVFIGCSMDRPLVPSWYPAEPPLQMLGFTRLRLCLPLFSSQRQELGRWRGMVGGPRRLFVLQ